MPNNKTLLSYRHYPSEVLKFYLLNYVTKLIARVEIFFKNCVLIYQSIVVHYHQWQTEPMDPYRRPRRDHGVQLFPACSAPSKQLCYFNFHYLLSGVPDFFDRNKILSGYDLFHYQVPHCIRVFFYFVWFEFIHHNFQFHFKLCTYCNILDIYLS